MRHPAATEAAEGGTPNVGLKGVIVGAVPEGDTGCGSLVDVVDDIGELRIRPDREYRAEDFVVRDSHVVVDIADGGRCDLGCGSVGQCLAVRGHGLDGGAVGTGIVDQLDDPVKVCVVDRRVVGPDGRVAR